MLPARHVFALCLSDRPCANKTCRVPCPPEPQEVAALAAAMAKPSGWGTPIGAPIVVASQSRFLLMCIALASSPCSLARHPSRTATRTLWHSQPPPSCRAQWASSPSCTSPPPPRRPRPRWARRLRCPRPLPALMRHPRRARRLRGPRPAAAGRLLLRLKTRGSRLRPRSGGRPAAPLQRQLRPPQAAQPQLTGHPLLSAGSGDDASENSAPSLEVGARAASRAAFEQRVTNYVVRFYLFGFV